MNRYEREEARRKQQQEAKLMPWVIYLNGKFFCRASSYKDCLSKSQALAKYQHNATITQRYEGRSISHQESRNDE